jgi:phosphocarrier protein HPr
MPQLHVTLGAHNGLHARPAARFVQAAARLPFKVTIARPGTAPVDARSLLSVLALAARHGEVLELAAEGDRAQEALEHLAALLADNGG